MFEIIVTILLILLLILLLTLLGIYIQFRNTINKAGISINEVKELLNDCEDASKYKPKSITGLSNILLPQIKKDQPNFNESEFYNKVESSLYAVFNSISNKKVSNNQELNLIREKIQEIIDDQTRNEIEEKFKDIKFHKHTIKAYDNKNGCLTITIASSLEYYYYKKVKENREIEYKDYKKQTSYISKYVYIYDPEAYISNIYALSAHCPNCGAILKNYSDIHCDFCGSSIEPINLKLWFISEYKEDER